MTEEQKTRLEKYLAKTTVDLSVWEAVLCLDLEAESEADPADNAEIDDEIDEEFSVDRPILGRATDYVKSDHQLRARPKSWPVNRAFNRPIRPLFKRLR
jgi:hypothetical protein